MEARRLEITTQVPCSNWCTYCPQGVLYRAYQSNYTCMTPSNYAKYISSVPDEVDIHYSGFSEPFVNFHIESLLRITREKGHNITIFTTLNGIEKVNIKEALKGVKLYVHAPYLDAKWEKKWLKNIKLLDGYDYKIIVVGYDRSQEVSEILNEHDGNIILQPIVTRSGHLWDEPNKEYNDCQEKRYNQNVLMPNGDVYLCCNDYGLENKIGNLAKQDYGTIIKSKKYNDIINKIHKGNQKLICAKCHKAIKK